jgi:putative transposase
MVRAQYPSDVSDAQWANIRDLLSIPRQGGRPRTYEMREIADAVLYVQRTGCPWRLLPHDFPPWRTVYYHLRRWRQTGAWDQAAVEMRKRKYLVTTQRQGREPAPDPG